MKSKLWISTTNPAVSEIKVKQGKRVNWLFLKIPTWISILIDSSPRNLFIDLFVDMFILKMAKLSSPPVSPSYPKQGARLHSKN